MSNWQNHLLLFIQKEMNRLFWRAPIGAGFNFSYLNVEGLLIDQYGEDGYDKAWTYMVDQLVIIITPEVTNNWSLNEDMVEDIQVWADSGTTYIHFEDKDNWYELEIRT